MTCPPAPVASYNPQYPDPSSASMESLQRTMGAAHAVPVRDSSSVSAARSPLWPSEYEWGAVDDWHKPLIFETSKLKNDNQYFEYQYSDEKRPLVGPILDMSLIASECATLDPTFARQVVQLKATFSCYRPFLDDGNSGWRGMLTYRATQTVKRCTFLTFYSFSILLLRNIARF